MVVIEDKKVDEGISKNSLWAIIVILLIVIGVETTVLFTRDYNPSKQEEDSPIQQLPDSDNSLLGVTDNSGSFPTQSPNRIPTLIPEGSTQGNSSGSRTKDIVVNREYTFPLNGPNGVQSGSIKFVVNKYGLQDTQAGQKILTVNLKLINQTNKAFQLQSRDYLSLSVNNSNWVAPGLHNDPVELRPNYTAETAVGFRLDPTDKNLRLKVNIPGGETDTFALSI